MSAGSLRNGFVYDDVPQVVRNPWIRDAGQLPTVFTTGAWDYAGTTSNYYRPMMHVVYMATYGLFGLDPRGFHAVNVVLHAAVCVVLFACTRGLFRLTGLPARAAARLAAGAALLFAVHPIHTEVVYWIGGVPDLLVAVFLLAALHVYSSRPDEESLRGRLRLLAAVACFLLALLSKEVALVFPGILLAHDLAFRSWQQRGLRRQALAYLPFAVAFLVYFALRVNALGALAPVRRHAELGPFALLLNVFPLLGKYLYELLVPAGLTVFHAFDPVTSAGDARVLAGALAVLAFGALGLLLWRAGGFGFLAWSVVLLPLIPVLYVPALGENPFAERYLYLPSAGFVWLLVIGAHRVTAGARSRWTPAVIAAGAVLFAVYSFGSVTRQAAWASDETLWTDAVQKSPDAAVAHYNLAVALQSGGRLQEAEQSYRSALRIQPSPVAWTSLGALYRQLGRTDDALIALQAALQLQPDYAPALEHLRQLRAGGRR
jgi:tetratricopeptide (TPR) repeat protein